jgi:hypothetical protein
MRMDPRHLLRATALTAFSLCAFAHGPVDVKITAPMGEYCRIVQFSKGWGKIPARTEHEFAPIFGYDSEYEFRVPGLLETKFLVRGIDPVTKNYTANVYEVDLAARNTVTRLATEGAWQAGTPVRLRRFGKAAQLVSEDRGGPIYVRLEGNQPLQYHGLSFGKTGKEWALEESRLSPGKSLIVLQSWEGSLSHSADIPLSPSSGRSKGKLFFDVFNVESGKKILTIQGTYVDINPGHALTKPGWLTERYFIVPLGERERCLVCEFGARPENKGALRK